MNASIIDPLQGDFPEVIEEYLEHGITKCVAFNRRGTLLAAGCSDGSCIIWDFETRGIAKELRDQDFSAAITSVCWSKYGHRILVSAADKSLTLWDVVSGKKVSRTILQQTPLQARLHPGSSTPSLCLPSQGNIGFNNYGDLVYAGNSKGEIVIIDHKSFEVRAIVPISGGAVVKNIVFSRNGQYLLTNSNDRTIRIYENLLPPKGAVHALDELNKNINDLDGAEKLKAVGLKCLVLFRDFQDSITRIHWKVPCFSGDGEWVIGGSASKGEHKIYIWDRLGHLVKILEGPKEALIDLSWHPIHPIVVSVSLTGLVYIWAKDYTENWSAFAPDFKELEENEEYVEREDEFDLMPDTEKGKESNVNEDEEVDILTMENDDAFSDSDMSQEEVCFLPALPLPDVPEEPEKHLGNSLKLVDNNHSESPLSEENGNVRQAMDHASSPAAEDDMAVTRLKRKRKPSEKGMELQTDYKEKKSLNTKPSANGKSSKLKNKSVSDQDTSACVLGDDIDVSQ